MNKLLLIALIAAIPAVTIADRLADPVEPVAIAVEEVAPKAKVPCLVQNARTGLFVTCDYLYKNDPIAFILDAGVDI